MRPLATLVASLLAITACLALPGHARAEVVWDEAVDGDLSGDGLDPTTILLSAGSNNVIATMGFLERDYFEIVVPENHEFTGLVLVSYAGDDFLSFIGVQEGPQMTVPPNTSSDEGLLGWAHFGDFGQVGTDILPEMGTNVFEGVGFTPPLPSGSYTFWIQQIDGFEVVVEFEFQVAPIVVAGLDGDYNGDTVVDAADYTVWRNNLGTDFDLAGNGDETGASAGTVDEADYLWWKQNYGNSGGGAGGLGSIVPEPASLSLLTASIASAGFARSRRITNRRR